VTIVLLVAFGLAALGLAGCESTKPAKGDDATAQPAAPAGRRALLALPTYRHRAP
jgi:hypothetical protein